MPVPARVFVLALAFTGCPAPEPGEGDGKPDPTGDVTDPTDTDTDPTDTDVTDTDVTDTDTDPTDTDPTDTDTDTELTDTAVPDTGVALPCFADYTLDRGTDGVLDELGLDTYDPARPALLLSSFLDYDASGSFDWNFWFAYDAAGNMLERRTDNDGDGQPDWIDTYTYDAAGHELTELTDLGVDGTIDSSVVHVYDVNGLLLSYERDNDGDGVVDYGIVYTHDSAGRIDAYEIDGNGDGTVDSVTQIVYDDVVGLTGTWYEDYDLDGIPDIVVREEYDSAGLLVYDGYDFENDGVFDSEHTYGYDAVTGLLLTVVTEIGPLTERSTTTWDGAGRRVGLVSETRFGGMVLGVDTFAWGFGGSCP